MTDERDPARAEDAGHSDDAGQRIEEARSEAAAYVVQRQPLEPGDIGQAEERIVKAVEQAGVESDPDSLEELAEEAEAGRDDIRRELYGRGSERRTEGG